METYFGGIDVSSEYFDVFLLNEKTPSPMRFDNNKSGFRHCLQWLKRVGVNKLTIAFEPTGRYGDALAETLYRSGFALLQVQPFQFRKFAESLDMRCKSDAKDCIALAQYAKERADQLREWHPKSVLQHELRDMKVLIQSLTKRKVALKLQLQCGLRSSWVKKQIQIELSDCEEKLDAALDRALTLIDSDPILANDMRLITSIVGIGDKTALTLLILIPFREFSSSRAVACFLGLTKAKYESGSSIHRREGISKRGSTLIRGELFMPARTARKHNPEIAEFAKRMEAKGKHDWTIQMAVIRKLVTTCWSLIHHDRLWEPNYINPHYVK